MRYLYVLICAAALVSCTRPEDRSTAAGTAGDTLTAGAATAERGTISLGDLAGTWKMRSTDERGGAPVETEVRIAADTSGWTMTGPDRKPVPVRLISAEGDSIVTEAGPFGSFVRKGVQVTTRTVYRLEGERLVGTTEARYKIGGRDSVAQRRTEGTRVQ